MLLPVMIKLGLDRATFLHGGAKSFFRAARALGEKKKEEEEEITRYGFGVNELRCVWSYLAGLCRAFGPEIRTKKYNPDMSEIKSTPDKSIIASKTCEFCGDKYGQPPAGVCAMLRTHAPQ